MQLGCNISSVVCCVWYSFVSWYFFSNVFISFFSMFFSPLFLQRVYRVGFLFVIVLVILDLLAFFYYPETIFGDLFFWQRVNRRL